MNTIIIGFSRPKKWMPFAKLIMFGYGINYDHAYIKIYSKKLDRTLVYQASKSMVNFMGSEVFEEHNIIVNEKTLQVSEDTLNSILKFAIDNAGKPYGIKACLGLAIVRIFELFGRVIKNPFNDKGATYFCSELVCMILERVGIKIPKDADDMSPKDVYNLVINN